MTRMFPAHARPDVVQRLWFYVIGAAFFAILFLGALFASGWFCGVKAMVLAWLAAGGAYNAERLLRKMDAFSAEAVAAEEHGQFPGSYEIDERVADRPDPAALKHAAIELMRATGWWVGGATGFVPNPHQPPVVQDAWNKLHEIVGHVP